MRVKIEYGCRVRNTDIERTEVVETNNFYQLYCDLKRKYIVEHNIEGDPNNSAEDYLNIIRYNQIKKGLLLWKN